MEPRSRHDSARTSYWGLRRACVFRVTRDLERVTMRALWVMTTARSSKRPPAMRRAGRVIESVEDPSRPLPHCLVIDGWEETLEQYLDARAGRLCRSEVVFIAEGFMRALSLIHAAGRVHTAVNPATVARHWDGSWRLIDLHLLRAPGDDAATALLPARRRRQYFPPELLAIEYALGVSSGNQNLEIQEQQPITKARLRESDDGTQATSSLDQPIQDIAAISIHEEIDNLATQRQILALYVMLR